MSDHLNDLSKFSWRDFSSNMMAWFRGVGPLDRTALGWRRYTLRLKKRPTVTVHYIRQILTDFPFSTLFHWHILYTICNKMCTKYPTTP